MKNYLHICCMIFIQTVSLVSYVVNFKPFGFKVNVHVKTNDSPFVPLPPPQFFLANFRKARFPIFQQLPLFYYKSLFHS